ncbi:MAG: DUF72 domain-containing protein [Anaerolineales bacterium]
MKLYVGCPIWTYKGWIGSLFPERTKSSDYLREYARRLTTVEGNTTFYAVPAEDTIRRWVEETPETFQMCPKLPRTISHAGKLVAHIEEARSFLEVMSQLGSRLGPMFLQLPPRYSPKLFEDLRAFLNVWPQQQRLAVEVRHPDWFDSEHNERLNRLLSERGMARVVIDTRPIRDLREDRILEGSVYLRMLEARERKPDVPILPERTTDFAFLRYIGHPLMERNAPFLDEWADYLASLIGAGDEAYVFCHCPDEGLDPWLCRELHQRIADKVPVSPLPWDEADGDTARQPRLL